MAQGFSRWMAITKSPLTGGYARSVAGADFGAWLKFAGFDFLLIEGRADRPVYIYLEGDRCQIRDASFLWGKDTEQTQQMLQEVHGRHTRSACIGPAGERLVRFAVIASARRTASRGGVGTVMGSKNLKAVAINAQRQDPIHDPAAFKELTKWQAGALRDSSRRKHMTNVGTTYAAEQFNEMGLFPVRNFQEGRLETIDKLSADTYTGIKTGNFGCYSCMVRCGQMHQVAGGPYAGAHSEGPEYETIWSFGGDLVNDNIASTVAADALCDLLGIDTISMGNIVAFAMELFEREILTHRDTDGLELRWGNHQALIELINKVASREGIGDLLAEGVKRAAEQIGKGAEDYAMHVKGMEISAYEPRAAKAHGLNYATANNGASHNYGYARQEIFGGRLPRPVDRFADEGKGDITAWNQKMTAAEEVGILCNFASAGVVNLEVMGRLLVAATGMSEFGDAQYLERVGERILCLERCFNVREGFSRKDDRLPHRMLTEPLRNAGPSTGQVVRKLDTLLDEYYAALGYAPNGVPTPQKLAELGLDFAIEDMAQAGANAR
jgi:aldehyde:ferredoxin oxidoreductase